MKTNTIGAALFLATAATVALSPTWQSMATGNEPSPVPTPAEQPSWSQQHPRIEVVFVLDTTGSMAGLIQAAKEKIWSIASTMASAEQAPQIRMGLVAYRDRGDEFVTRVVDLSADLDAVYATLLGFQADGGGDGPESVNQALHEAVHQLSWSQDPQTYKVVFLVGDAPPHMDYQDDVKYPQTLAAATARGIVVNAIQCGPEALTRQVWEQIAALGGGHYFQVEQSGSAVAMSTPYDQALAKLSRLLDETRLYYGSGDQRQEREQRLATARELYQHAPAAALAGRAAFNASASGVANFSGEGELLSDLADGRVDLDALPEQELPRTLQALSPEVRSAEIAETAARRQALQTQIESLGKLREGYLQDQVRAIGGAKRSLDDQIYAVIREQAASKGLSYGAETPVY